MRPWRVSDVEHRSSWSGTVQYHFEHEHRPRDVDALREVVAAADHLRPVGTSHSFTDLPDGTVAVSTAALRDVEVLDDGAAVRVGSGLTHAALAEALRPAGLALENLASLPHLNVAGAVSTATHGSGTGHGNLATQVRAVELVLADGTLTTVRRGDPDLDGVVVGLGVLGVVTALELDVVPAVPHRQVVLVDADTRTLPDRLADLQRLGRSVSVFTRWDDAPQHVWVKWREGDPAPDPAGTGLVAADHELHPIPGIDPVHCTPQQGVPGWWADRLPHFRSGYLPSSGDEVQSEYHLPAAHAADAARALQEVGSRIRPALLVGEIRSVAADTLWLSPQHERDTTSFHFTWVGDVEAAGAAARVVEEALAPFSPRPHWGKLFHLDVRDAYPRLADFHALRTRLDPDGVFVGPWFERVLGGADRA